MGSATITSLFVYPVKSFGGISLVQSVVEARGLKHDRRWMLVDEGGIFMTQRTDTRLALFRTGLEEGGLRLQSPSGESILAPYDPEGPVGRVRVWKDDVLARQVNDAVDDWLSDNLNKRCSLVYMPDESIRQPHLGFTHPGDKVGFADAFPVLIIGESSLTDLNGRLAEPLPINRFRGNIIVRGWDPFEEDRWATLSVGNLVFRAAKQCGRCSVTATDQETGVVGIEPLRTLAIYRLGEKAVLFGAYFVPESRGEISVGDAICPK